MVGVGVVERKRVRRGRERDEKEIMSVTVAVGILEA